MVSRSPRGTAILPPKGYHFYFAFSIEFLVNLIFLSNKCLFFVVVCVDGSKVFEEPEVCEEAQQEEWRVCR